MFVLLTGDSAAGSPPPGRFSPSAEADLIWWGITAPSVNCGGLEDGLIPPAIFTRSARMAADFPTLVVNCGTLVPPVCPYMETGAFSGRDPRHEMGVPDAEKLWDSGFSIGRLLAGMNDNLVIGESSTGSGVVAPLILKALGYKAEALEGSDGSEEGSSAWELASSRLGIRPGDLIGRGFYAASELGDPVLVVAAGIAAGARGGSKVLLSGGLPMLAVAALMRDMGDRGSLALSVTGRTLKELGGDFELISDILKAETYKAQLDSVKDGAGASGAAWCAENSNITLEMILERASILCEDLSYHPGEGEQ